MAKILVNSAAIRKKDLIVVDGDLNVVADAKITVVDNVTGSYALIYDKDDKNTLMSNPFTSDDTGQFSFWVAPGVYKIGVVTQTDSQDLEGSVVIDVSQQGFSSISVEEAKDLDFTGQSIVLCSSFRGDGGASEWVSTGVIDQSKASTIVVFESESEYGVFYDSSGNQFKLNSKTKTPLMLGAYNSVVQDDNTNIDAILEANKNAFKALEYFRGNQFVESGFYILKEPIYIRPLTTFKGASKGNGSSGKLTSDFNASNGATVFVPHSSFDMSNFQDADGETYLINIEDFPQTTPDPNPNLNRFNDGYAGGVEYGNFQINLADYAAANTRVAKIASLGGLREYRAYDSATSHDINILWHGEAKAFKWDAEPQPTLRVSQTNERRALFSLGDDVERTSPVALCRRQQESQFYGLKLLAAPQGSPRVSQCLIVEDSRAVEFYSPSFASIKDEDFVRVISTERTCSNINFYSPTVENAVGTTTGFNFIGNETTQVVQVGIVLPRTESPAPTVFVKGTNCLVCDVDVGQRKVEWGTGAESNVVRCKDVYQITDNNQLGRNQVVAEGNKSDRVETHKQPIRSWQSDQLSPFFELAAGSNPNSLKKFRIQYDANDSINLGATFRDLDSNNSWVFLPSGAMQTYSLRVYDVGTSSYRSLGLEDANLTINGVQKTGGATGTATSANTLTIVDGRITNIT